MTCHRVLSYAAGLGLVVALAGCGGDDPTVQATSSTGGSSSTSSSSSSSSGSSTTSSSGRTLEVTITGRKVDPAPTTVPLAVGQSLTLTVTSDHDDVLHIHGFDIEKDLKAGQPTTVTVTGKDPGVFEVETHETELRLLKIAVQ
jgi:plastocyanin